MKRFVKTAAVLAAMVLSLALAGCSDDDDDDETVMVEKTVVIENGNYFWNMFSLKRAAKISGKVEVKDGKGVTVFFMNPQGYRDFRDETKDEFFFYNNLSIEKPMMTFSKSMQLPAGTYYFVVDNGAVTENDTNAAQTVFVKLSAE